MGKIAELKDTEHNRKSNGNQSINSPKANTIYQQLQPHMKTCLLMGM